MTQPAQARSEKVDFGPDPQAPEAPDVGVAISLLAKSKVAAFSLGQPIMLHGSFQADIALIRLCREGLSSSILVTLLRTDQPWGKTLRLVTPQTASTKPEPPQEPGRDYTHYRQGGQFKVDLVRLFGIPKEPGKYQVEAILGPHHSQRLEFEVR